MEPKIYIADDHEIDPVHVDPDAIFVIEKLRDAGFQAYLVGGGVRDLLTKRKPKDFDISTSALPEEVKRVFHRRCLLIGRRFRLAHIRFGHKVIEVSTFRSGENESELIVRDNQWGTPAEDVLRRDFTINGLFYDPKEHVVIDYVDGWNDIHSGVLRTIGDPTVRFKQDPVRMIRLLKFRARFGFEIAPETKQALLSCREEIIKSSPARILEELLRMLESGASAPFFHLMIRGQVLQLLFPVLAEFLEGEHGDSIYRFLDIGDKINQQRNSHPLPRPLMLAALLYPILEQEVKKGFLDVGGVPHMGDIIVLISSLIKKVVLTSFSQFPRRLTSSLGYILATQYRLTPLSGKRHYHHKLFSNKEFSWALEFFKIRAIADKNLLDTYQRWEALFHQHGHRGEQPKKKKYIRRRRS